MIPMNSIKKFFIVISIFTIGFICGSVYNSIFEEETRKPVTNSIANVAEKIISHKEQEPKTFNGDNKIIEEKYKAESINKENLTPILETVEKKLTAYEEFVSNLNTSQYQKALDTYQNHVNNETITMYHDYLFSYIKVMSEDKDADALTLINKFLEIEFNNTPAMYLQSQILFQNKNYEKAIFTLLDMKSFYLENDLESKVTYALEEFSSFYVKKLQANQNHDKLIAFLTKLLNNNQNNTKYIFTLGKLYFELNHYSKAKDLLEQLLSDDTYKNKAQYLLSMINKKIELAEKFSRQIQLEKKGTHFLVKAILNDDVDVTLLLDTGASMSVIDSSIIEQLTYEVIKEKVLMNTAGGIVSAKQVQIDSFMIDDSRLNSMQVISSKIKNEDFDGLLGMNYLMKFDFYIDQDDAVLYLESK